MSVDIRSLRAARLTAHATPATPVFIARRADAAYGGNHARYFHQPRPRRIVAVTASHMVMTNSESNAPDSNSIEKDEGDRVA